MKNILVSIVVLLLVVVNVMAQCSPIGVNIVGFQKTAIPPNGKVMLVLNYVTFGKATIKNIIKKQLPVGSSAYIWDRTKGKYSQATCKKNGWVGAGANMIIERGDAFWLLNAGGKTNYVMIAGEVPLPMNDSESTAIDGLKGCNAVGYAYPADIIWTNSTLAASAAIDDALYIWNVNTQNYSTYQKGSDGWNTPVNFVISAGVGFWINTKATFLYAQIYRNIL